MSEMIYFVYDTFFSGSAAFFFWFSVLFAARLLFGKVEKV